MLNFNPKRGAKYQMDAGEEERMNAMAAGDSRLAADCFRVEFKGAAHTSLLERITELRDMVNPDVHYSVYSALVQSSCVGKSRAVLEMSQLGVHICYCSLASATSSAYPPRTSTLADKLQTTYTEHGMVLYLKAWLVVLKSHLQKTGMSPVDWKDRQLDGTKEISHQVRLEWDSLDAAVNSSTSTSSMAMDVEFVSMDKKNEAILQAELNDIVNMLGDEEVRVVFVFDEARGLHLQRGGPIPVNQSPFYQLRRVLRTLFYYETFFALMLDTAAEVSNSMPRKEDEHSSRALSMGTELLPPIYYVPTMKLNIPRPGLHVEEYVKPATWLRYGRPIWAARIEKDVGDRTGAQFRDLLRFARRKLVQVMTGMFQNQSVNLWDGEMTQSQAMALLAAGAGVDICPRSYLAETLAASHMSLILRITRDRSMVFVTTPPEPVLSEAAATLLCKPPVQKAALKHMLHACGNGYVTGPRGEFVARFILVAAVWKLKQQGESWFLRPIPVEVYLEKLLVNNIRDTSLFEKLKSRLPQNGLVFFNSLVLVEEPPNVVTLGRCYVGGHAMMHKAEPGCDCDIIIPIWTPHGMTAIVISVNNMKNAGWLEEPSVDKLKCEFMQVEVAANLPVLTLTMLMQEPKLANPTNWSLWKEREEDGHTHVTCYGLRRNYTFLNGEVKQLLEKVLATVPNPLLDASPEEDKWIKDMLPDTFDTSTQPFL